MSNANSRVEATLRLIWNNGNGSYWMLTLGPCGAPAVMLTLTTAQHLQFKEVKWLAQHAYGIWSLISDS